MQEKQSIWPLKAIGLSKDLHDQLRLSEKNWHQLKSNKERRAAELLSGALTQLLQGGEYSDIQAMVTQGMLWLNQEIRDPGCPRH